MIDQVESLVRQLNERRLGRREFVAGVLALVASGGASAMHAQTT